MKRKFPTHVSESKNNTHVKKVGHTSEFLFDIYCWTSKKPDYLLKKVLKWVNKKYKNFNIYMLYLKTKEKHLEISLFCECDRLEFVIMGHFLSFYTPSLKNPQNCWRYHHFTYVCQKPQSYEYGSWVTPCETEFFVILGHFFPFIPLTTNNIEILKKWKNHLEMSLFYACVPKIMIISSMFLSYGVWQT